MICADMLSQIVVVYSARKVVEVTVTFNKTQCPGKITFCSSSCQLYIIESATIYKIDQVWFPAWKFLVLPSPDSQVSCRSRSSGFSSVILRASSDTAEPGSPSEPAFLSGAEFWSCLRSTWVS